MTRTPKPPAHLDPEMERALLGGLMLDTRLLSDVSVRVSPEDFGDPQHGAIYAALQHLVGAGLLHTPQVDLLLLESALKDLGTWGQPVQESALLACYGHLTDPTYLPEYADAIRQLRIWRDLAVTLDQYREKVQRGRGDPAPLLMDLQGQLVTTATNVEGRRVLPISEIEDDWRTYIERRQERDTPFSDYPTGFAALDLATLGLEPGDDFVLGGATGCGKTAFALNMAVHYAAQGTAVLFCSLEMTHRQIYSRLLVIISGLDNYVVRAGKHSDGRPWTPEESTKIDAAKRALRGMAPIYVIPPQKMGIGELRTILALHRRKHERLVVMVDYIQKMKVSTKHGSPAFAYAELSSDLKQSALDFDAPLVLVSQLARPPQEVKGPTYHNFKESGGIENDANQAVILARVPEAQRYPGEGTQKSHPLLMDLHLLKQREGHKGKLRMLFSASNYRFGELPAKATTMLDDSAWKNVPVDKWTYPSEALTRAFI